MIDNTHGGYTNKGRIIDFSVNINPLGLPQRARAAVIKNIPRITRYPQSDSKNLKRALSDFHGLKIENIAAGNGSIELIYLIPKALAAKRVLIITPTFSEYEFACRSHGIHTIFFKTDEKDNFRIDFNRIKKYLPKTDLVFLGNPNNPTGSSLSIDEIKYLIGLCKRHETVLVTDEAFINFARDDERDPSLSAASKGRHHIIIRSLTKFFAIPGLRAGYAAANRDFIRKITGLQYPWNVNSLAQVIAEALLKDKDYINKSRNYISEERGYLFNRLGKIKGLKTFPSFSNFILCKLERSVMKSAKVLNELLLKRGLFVRNCGNFRALNERFFRVAVRKHAENDRLIKAIESILV